MKNIFTEFVNEWIIGLLSAFLLITKDYITKNLSKLYDDIIRSRFTPSRLSYQEAQTMEDGLEAGILKLKKEVFASHVYILSIAKNGTDTFRQHLTKNDECKLNRLEVGDLQTVIDKLKKEKILIIENTEKETTETQNGIFNAVLASMGYNSVNLILIESKYKTGFFLVVHTDKKITAIKDIDYLKKSLLQYRDPIETLYFRR